MNAECISIGDELLLGITVNTNASWLGTELAKIGVSLEWVTTIGDNEKHISSALKTALGRTDIVIITGGLGPTHDDITKDVVVKHFDSELIFDKDVMQSVEDIFKRREIEMPDINKQQAYIPHNCKVLKNRKGTAPGMLFTQQDKKIIVLPGVPSEMKVIMEDEGLSLLEEDEGHSIQYETISTTGVSESLLFETINNLEEIEEFAKVAFLPKYTGVNIRLTVKADSIEESKARLENAKQLLIPKIEKWVYSTTDEAIEEAIARLLIKNKKRVATAESCTGGLVANMLTNVPGSSNFFEFGAVTYSNEFKQNILGVNQQLLEEKGAVSAEVAQAMAEGIRKKADADYGLALTGIAGPTGATKGKPVGLVYISLSSEKGTIVKRYVFSSDRIRNKQRFAQKALDLLRIELSE